MSPVREKVLYFGKAGDITGRREELVAMAEGSVGDLLDELESRYAALGDFRRSSRVAANEELVDEKFEPRGGDTVALLPPVAGG